MADLKIHNLKKGFDGNEIIKGIDLDIRDREFVVFVGPSGCGKSTLLRLIAGLEEVSSGRIELDGRDITDVSPAKRDLAMVFQTYALYPHMTVRKNMSFALDLAGADKQEVARKIEAAAPSCATPRCFSSMNRCPTSMRRCGSACGSKSRNCTSGFRPR